MNDWAEFRHFKYLLAIAEYGGFRAAALHLGTAEPNLSVQAKQFQEACGIRLLEKTSTGRSKLTETGRAFIAIARELLRARDEAIAALIAVERGEIEVLRFGCASCIDRDLFGIAQSLHKELLPKCAIRPVHGGTRQLAEELSTGAIDVAILTSTVDDVRLQVEEIRRDRLLVCLRKDDALAQKGILQPSDLKDMPVVIYHPQLNPKAHVETLSYLAEVGARTDDFAQASHPAELQALVKDGYGIALVREGTDLDLELVAKPVGGVNWMMGTSIAYHRLRHPKSVPVLARHLKLKLGLLFKAKSEPTDISKNRAIKVSGKRGSEEEDLPPEQMSLLG